jgi:DNA-binding response OmpR family regulator
MKSLQDRRILAVDDDPLMRFLLAKILSNAGAQVQAAASGQEGLDRFQVFQPDLVLLDDKMPDMDGWQLCLRIRAQATVPIIVLPAVWRAPDVILEQNDVAIDCLPKPFRPDTLLALAGYALGQQQASRCQT